MFAGLLDHHRAELPHYKRIAKKKLAEIKDDYVRLWKEEPAYMTAAVITGISVTTAVYYRHMARKIYKGSWVELLQEWEDAMVDRGAVLGMVVDGGQLRAKIFEREETKY
jgi:hypothetical protein